MIGYSFCRSFCWSRQVLIIHYICTMYIPVTLYKYFYVKISDPKNFIYLQEKQSFFCRYHDLWNTCTNSRTDMISKCCFSHVLFLTYLLKNNRSYVYILLTNRIKWFRCVWYSFIRRRKMVKQARNTVFDYRKNPLFGWAIKYCTWFSK